MCDVQFETVIIGGGQAGLATAYHLTQRGLPCVILDENDQVGAAWRNRWNSLRLFTPGRYNHLPGMPLPGPPRSFPGKDDIADYLQTYVSHFKLPIRKETKVSRISADGDGYMIETKEESYFAYNVVVATGAFHNPRIPEFAGKLHPQIVQLHSLGYQTQSQVQNGPVLVVGAGQSGAEIALDMARNHKVWLSGRDTGEEPTGRNTFVDRLITPVMVFAATKVINVANPLGRKLRNHFFYPPRGIPRAGGTKKLLHNAGVEWVERTAGTRDGYPQLEDGRVLKVANVIWCTGFKTDYSWIDLPIFDSFGYPVHKRGVVSSQPGLYFMGLPFQSTLSSTLIMGVGKDARYIANHILSNRVGKKVKFNTNTARKKVAQKPVPS
ncbi:MAG: FAD-dependent oxidoreductase [Bacteroidales bacterium]